MSGTPVRWLQQILGHETIQNFVDCVTDQQFTAAKLSAPLAGETKSFLRIQNEQTLNPQCFDAMATAGGFDVPKAGARTLQSAVASSGSCRTQVADSMLML